jgi:hypothetical protein
MKAFLRCDPGSLILNINVTDIHQTSCSDAVVINEM